MPRQRTRNATFGAGSFPSSPSASVAAVTAVGDSATLQLGVSLSF